MDIDFAADRDLGELSGEEAWEAIENFTQGQKEWDNPPNIIYEQEVANLKAQAKRLFGNEDVWVQMHRGIAWDKVENLDPQNTPQVLLSFEEYTPPATYLEEVKETLGISIEVEPLDETPLEDLGLNTYNHDIPLISREIPSIDEPEPKPQPLPNCLSLDLRPRLIAVEGWTGRNADIKDGERMNNTPDDHYALWEVIENGATLPKSWWVVESRTAVMEGYYIKDAKLLLEVVEKRVGGNAATKKTRRNLLKRQYENFTSPSSKMVDQTFDRLQKLVIQSELLDKKLLQEDVNQKRY
ncbi:hypothetical protein Tco_1304169 [Tanacetum coccineum]